ncbi:hypothetical protein C9374_003256 [Naegleria lovaniensis]|uniref:TAP-C domain-containing protein n=1 Tax=Naegleria lovaniensis TaxID=51637 RepID=A0AA88GNM4_NAELO|nr:uncharacterized protein C9374_003256 [Naegleria lovaniensis]KAG2385441.1 hypothetical protein C9374_003256 [Naegleria lovaniensis]
MFNFKANSDLTTPSNSTDTIAIQMLNYCIQNGEDVTLQSCLDYLKYFKNNLETALLFMIKYPKEMHEKTGMSIHLARNILEDSEFNLLLCQSRVELVLKLIHESGLNFEFSYQCLVEFNWNYPNALLRVNNMKNNGEIPERGFLRSSNAEASNTFLTTSTKQEVPVNAQFVAPSAFNTLNSTFIAAETVGSSFIKHETNTLPRHNIETKQESSTVSKKKTKNAHEKSVSICQHPGCSNPVEKNRKKYCEYHAARPLKIKAMEVDFVKCVYEGCTNPVEKGRKKYCKEHGYSKNK